eukprot:TRINITY_DN29394_c0_g3_i1.p1 TRINITY_DN29394_c0_g3~~TRINITY_DN29394_c0_g3_i1.p1  ORF type:complete len:673 (-),score=173.03 TRINITY_DN29394_c0_g3_i1:38-2056(-)
MEDGAPWRPPRLALEPLERGDVSAPEELLNGGLSPGGGSTSSRPPRQTRHQLWRDLEQDLRPGLLKAKSRVLELTEASARKKEAIAALSACRQQAAESLGSLSRRQLSEIRQLCRSPPENVKRTLAAAWLLLHAEKYRGKSAAAVQFDDIKDWGRCQKMLADDSFIARILEFDTVVLMAAPQLLAHVSASYLGLSVPSKPSQVLKSALSADFSSGASEGTRPSTAVQQEEQLEATGCRERHEDRQEERRGSKGTPRIGLQMASRALARRSTSNLRESLRNKGPLPPLELQAVARASEPCGRLLLWMQSLLQEVQQRGHLEVDLAQCEAELQLAEQTLETAEAEAAKAEAAWAALATPRPAVKPLPEVPAAPSWNSTPASVCRSPRKPLGAILAPLAKVADAGSLAQLQEKPAPKLLPKPEVLKAPIELDVTGELASVQAQLSKLKTCFGKNLSEVLISGEGDGGEMATASLPRVAELLREHRDGRLKLLIEGHRQCNERDGLDLERAQAVKSWLVDMLGVSSGLLRVIAVGTQFNDGAGARLVLARPLRELVPLYGPIAPEAAAARAPVGMYFEGQSVQLGAEAAAILKEMALWLKKDKSSPEVVIEGHCDRLEPQAQQLSLQRATAARDFLVSLGVAPKKLVASGLGWQYPLSLQNRASNRRVEVHLRGRT